MALRSVVVDNPASPPAPRRTVVLRPGGPVPRGHLLDVILGVLGALLLVGAVVLAGILPDKTYLNPQFRLSFVEGNAEGPGSKVGEFTEASPGNAQEFTYDIPDDNVKTITLDLGFRDDIVYSLPDRFDVDLIAPNGTVMGHLELENPAPKAGRNATDPPQTFAAEGHATFTTGPSPSEQIVTGLTHTETQEQVHARLEPQFRVATAGTWTVRVELVAAQDCPTGPNDGSFQGQAAYCRGIPAGVPPPTSGGGEGTSNDGTDPGNPFILANLTYTFYTVTVEELK